MTSRPLRLVCLLSVTIALFHSVLFAQKDDNRENLRTTAAIKGVKGDILMCLDKDGKTFYVKLPSKKDQILYTGSAHPNWLRPGMFVSVSAKIDSKGKPISPLSQLSVITPSADTKIGAFPDITAAAGEQLFTSDKEKPKAKATPYSITGRISAIRNGKIAVQAGRASVEFEVDEDASIRVQVADVRLMQLDDTAVINGWAYKNALDKVQANRISIESSKVLGEPKKSAKAGEGAAAKENGEAKESDEKPNANEEE